MLTYLTYAIRYIFWGTGNSLRRVGKAPDWVVFTLEGAYPEPSQTGGNPILRRLRPPKLSVRELAEQIRTVAGDCLRLGSSTSPPSPNRPRRRNMPRMG